MNRASQQCRPREAGLTLVEVVFGLTVLTLVASTAFFAFAQVNKVASIARLLSAAQYVCQTQIDTIMGDTPFNPQNGVTPAELTITGSSGATTSSTSSAVTIYTDPATNQNVVTGTMTTSLVNISNSSQSEYAYRATVVVGFTYRSHYYQVAQSTVRASDQ